MAGAGVDAPTGCFKCGTTGHWSSDCPLNHQQDSQVDAKKQQQDSQHGFKRNNEPFNRNKIVKDTKKKPRGRPKLTPELLLSDKGLGYLLERLPQNIVIRGPGHEAHDLEGFVAAYKDWHASLLPSMTFKHFIGQVEALGSQKRVKMCLEDLRDKVATGADLKVEEADDDSQPEEVAASTKLDQEAMETVQDTVLDKAQRQRMEANRLKALEIRKARTGCL